MKTLKYIIGAVVVALGLNACVGDLNVTPIDPSLNTANAALKTSEDYFELLAQCYAGFSHSGSYGPNGNNNISGIDGGFSQYFRGRYHLNGLTTDEAICGWNDQTLQDLHGLAWTTTDVFVAAFYYRIFYQISAVNEFLRKLNTATIELPDADLWRAEARTIRAFCWLEALDNYGNVPFADETSPIGTYLPKQISRADLFTYIETELKELLADAKFTAAGQGEYGRMNKGVAAMILAKLYLNAEVYIGAKKYDECVEALKVVDAAYSLHTTPNGAKFSAFQDLFLADNHKCTEEIIWAVEQDGVNVQSYGVTNYLIFACTGGKMNTDEVGISSGWGGLRTTPDFYKKFSDNDARKIFYTKDHQAEIDDIGTFSNGYAFLKFKNVTSEGKIPNQTANKDEKTGEVTYTNPGFVNTDFPVFRYADALLMKAECAVRGAEGVDGLAAYNAVRQRAGLSAVSEYTLDNVLDERARELALEGWRRSDLIRFGKFTTADYLWQWKGGAKAGKAVSDHLNLFPIPENDKNANSNLVQNKGY